MHIRTQLAWGVVTLLHLAATSPVSQPSNAASATAAQYLSNAETALDNLQTFYNESTGLWKSYSPSWWQSANALTTLADMVDKGSAKAKQLSETIFPNTFTKAAAWNVANNHHLRRRTSDPSATSDQDSSTGSSADASASSAAAAWINNYYDDEGWWAMAWIRAYDATQEAKYLDVAKGLFADMTTGWGTNCSSDGLWWDKTHTSVAPIANVLFMEVAAWLAGRVDAADKQTYINWAEKEWSYLNSSHGPYLPKQHLVGTGFDLTTCTYKANPRPDYTYTQGTLVSALVALRNATGNEAYLDEAHNVADAVIATMTVNGVLQEPHIDQAHPGQSAPQFKGVFSRGLRVLQVASPSAAYVQFAQKCADSLWANDRNSGGFLGPEWLGPFYGPANASPHSSAMDALVAAWVASEN